MEGCMMEVPSWYGLALEKRLSGPCSSPSTLPSDISDCPMTSTAELLKQQMKMMKRFQLHPTAIHKLTLQHKNCQDLHILNIFIIFRKLPMISMIHMVNGELPDSDLFFGNQRTVWVWQLSTDPMYIYIHCIPYQTAKTTVLSWRLSYHVLSVLEKNAVEILLSWLSWLYPIYPDILYEYIEYIIYLISSDSSDSILTPCIMATDASSFEENCSGHSFGPGLI